MTQEVLLLSLAFLYLFFRPLEFSNAAGAVWHQNEFCFSEVCFSQCLSKGKGSFEVNIGTFTSDFSNFLFSNDHYKSQHIRTETHIERAIHASLFVCHGCLLLLPLKENRFIKPYFMDNGHPIPKLFPFRKLKSLKRNQLLYAHVRQNKYFMQFKSFFTSVCIKNIVNHSFVEI